jgi:hypothetical protein
MHNSLKMCRWGGNTAAHIWERNTDVTVMVSAINILQYKFLGTLLMKLIAVIFFVIFCRRRWLPTLYNPSLSNSSRVTWQRQTSDWTSELRELISSTPPTDKHPDQVSQAGDLFILLLPSLQLYSNHYVYPVFDICQWTKYIHKASEYPNHKTVLCFHWFIAKASNILAFKCIPYDEYQERQLKAGSTCTAGNVYDS